MFGELKFTAVTYCLPTNSCKSASYNLSLKYTELNSLTTLAFVLNNDVLVLAAKYLYHTCKWVEI